ncbi:Intraflagellar transport protein 46 [Globomyces sp. JEL0801]|nr:Intraflagellar transport protein 46 [Globomyces sp. JEL0801]
MEDSNEEGPSGDDKKMFFSSERPLTSRTRKRIEQLEDDESVALALALEEDEKIAKKLQDDYNNGIGVDDYHRLNTANHQNSLSLDSKEDFIEKQVENRQENESNIETLYRPEDYLGQRNQESTVTLVSKKQNDSKQLHQSNKTITVEPSKSNGKTTLAQYQNQRASYRVASTIPDQHQDSATGSDGSEIDELSYQMSNIRNDDIIANPLIKKSNPSLSQELLNERMNDRKERTVNKSSMKTENSITSGIESQKNINSTEKELKSLLEMINMFMPETIELEPKLDPFIPDFIPCIGDIDPMIKIPLPEKIKDEQCKVLLEPLKSVGLTLLDEPNSVQSDPAGNLLSNLLLVVDLALRASVLNDTGTNTNSKVRSINLPLKVSENDSSPSVRALSKWIDSVKEIHLQQKVTTQKGKLNVDMEQLMAEWPEEIDKKLSNNEVNLLEIDSKDNIIQF